MSSPARSLSRSEKMLTMPMPKLVLSMAFPSIIAFLIDAVYSLVDTYFVSGLGTNATAAISVNTSLDLIIMMGGTMLAVGAASYISRLMGQGDKDKAEKVLSTAFVLAVIFGSAVLLLGSVFMTPMIRLLGATPTCEKYAIQYATYVILVAPFMAANFVMNQCLRAEGNALLSMFGMGIGGVINCILDPIFIRTLNLGVAGASMATAISKLISFSILLFPYVTHRSELKLNLRKFAPRKEIVFEIATVGSSSMFRAGLGVLSAIVLNNIAGSISDSVMAGIGVSTRVMRIPMGIILGLGAGLQPIAGFAWGAKKYDRVRESFHVASLFAVISGLVIAGFLAVFAEGVITLFGKTDPDMQAIGALCIRAQCVVMVVHAWVAMVNMLSAGLGDAKSALLLSTSRQGSCFLPIIHLMAYLFGAVGVACVQAVADLLTLFLAIPVYRRTMKRITQAEQAEKEKLQTA